MASELTKSLTDRQRAFVSALVNGATPMRAALDAGYAHDVSGYAALRSPAVQAALREEIQAHLVHDATAARKLLRLFVDDDKTPPKVRLDAAKALLDRAGFTAAAPAQQATQRELHELSQEELRDRIGRLEVELSERSKAVLRDSDAAESGELADFLS